MIDVCFLLEGSYPYVAGGVSTWVHQLITAMKDIRFGIVSISAYAGPTRTLKYEVPNQVLFLKDIYLRDYDLKPHHCRRPRKKDFELLRQFYEDLIEGGVGRFPEVLRLFRTRDRCLDIPRYFSSKEIWDLLVYFYERFAEDASFLDYFWTWRGTHLPLLQILEAEIPPAKIYHAVSTGYAGLLGAMAKVLHGEKFFLTEHGIYTHERLLEISQANWIYEREKRNAQAERELSFFKKWWIGIFQVLSRLAYEHADRIFTLYEGNKVREILEGADPKKISIIPNGIDIKEISAIPIEKKPTPQIGLIGRVVSIKDIKTFIHAANLVLKEIPEAHFHIVGPGDEEEDYFQECQRLVEALRLEEKITFTGRVDIRLTYRFLDLVVLTSVFEAQPYVILEANAIGIPVVATDVGACRELLEGREPMDQALGPSGLLTEIANPEATARAILSLLKEKELYRAFGEAGKQRAKRYYNLNDLLSRYMNIYEQNL